MGEYLYILAKDGLQFQHKTLNQGSRFLCSAFSQKIAEEGIKNVGAYNVGVKRISNKKIKRVLESDLAKYVVGRAQKELYNWQNA